METRTCFKSLNDNAIIWFQYRILYRNLGVNDLAKIKHHPNGMCSLCKEYRETVLHPFLQCREVKTFWRNLRLRIQYTRDIDFDNSSKTILNVAHLPAKYLLFEAFRTSQNLNLQSFF